MKFKVGDEVSWNTSQGTTRGTVESVHTGDFEFKDQNFRASSDDPVYVVKSKKTGSTAAHHEGALESN